MSDIDTIISSNILHKIGEMVITDLSWKMIYRNNGLGFTDEQWEKWADIYREDVIDEGGLEWEIADRESGQFYKVSTFMVRDRDERRLIHHVYDISDYAVMFRELSEYSREWRTVADCQSEIIGALSDSPEDCLPVAHKYFKAGTVVLYVKRREDIVRYEITGKEGKTVSQRVMAEAEEPYTCCCRGQTSGGSGYALYVSDDIEGNSRVREMLYNEFKLSIENALLREQVAYENEHDALTGLYNRGKYAEMYKSVFPFYDSIAVYNLDVNYLKRTNDTFGHEMGNKLILKTADSIKAVLGENIYGFRVGGDEFLIVAGDLSRDSADRLKDRWSEALDSINEADPVPECVVACGMVYSEKPYDADELFREADRLMYADKAAIKISRGDEPDAR